MIHKNPKATRDQLAQALMNGTPRPNTKTGTMQIDGPTIEAPVAWQSSPDHPPTMLAYITAEEAALLSKKDLHNSGVDEKRHYGPQGIPSFNGNGSTGDGYGGGGDSSGSTGSTGTQGSDNSLSASQSAAYGEFGAAMDSLGGLGGGTLGGVGSPGYGGGYTSDGYSGQLSDFSRGDLNAMGRGGPFAGAYESGGLLGGIGRAGERAVQNAFDNPIATAINLAVPGGIGLANTVSGIFGGPTVGGSLAAAGRGIGDALGFNGAQAAAAQTASATGDSKGGGSAKGDGGPLSGDTTGGGSTGFASGTPGSPLGGNNNALAAALLGSPPDPSGRKTYGARVSSFSPFGREYVTPWAYRG